MRRYVCIFKASFPVIPIVEVSTSASSLPFYVIALGDVPPKPYLFGLAIDCIISTASDRSTPSSQLASPHIVRYTNHSKNNEKLTDVSCFKAFISQLAGYFFFIYSSIDIGVSFVVDIYA